MKIGKAIKNSRPPVFVPRYTFLPVWEKAAKLSDGECLPVECSDLKEKLKLQQAAMGHRTMRFHTRTEGMTVFLFKCLDEKCSAKHRPLA